MAVALGWGMHSPFTEREWVLFALAVLALAAYVWKALRPSARGPVRDLVVTDEPSFADAVLDAARRKPSEWKGWITEMFQTEMAERRETRQTAEQSRMMAERNADHLRAVSEILAKQDSSVDAQNQLGKEVGRLAVTLDHLAKAVDKVSDKVDGHDKTLMATQLEVGGIRSDFAAWTGQERRRSPGRRHDDADGGE